MCNAAVAAIEFALETEDGMNFLRLWNEGEFDVLRDEWPEAPEAIYIGADPLYEGHLNSEDDASLEANTIVSDADRQAFKSSDGDETVKGIAAQYYSIDALKRANEEE
ncbi:hypothetical protein J4N45_09825 [Vibrio sp. SCSIO 43140]|uniref:hypothetical protein n=1 Tax=Vibrio sp. SCSIO 43140 TaxID=2819100 RepID=UPI0020763551|nr:hypothetical protein [Vibrio sp. SCSIO 43140]USD58826.1 hypothetical protein J4N45_09825 [Vibrio sp. SCSIO 43140]